MPVLALDTSASVAVAVLGDDGGALARREAPERRRHAEALTPLIHEALAEAGLDPAELTAVAVGTGPAPFTGLRVGLVTARSFAFALGIPVLGVPSLDAIAAQAVADLGLRPDDELLAASDARRREVYWARYRIVAHEGPRGVAVLHTIAGPQVGPASSAADHAVDAVVVGEGAALYPEFLDLAPDAPLIPDAVVLGRLALVRQAAGEDLPTEPLYLRRPDVHVAGARKRVSDGAPFTVQESR